MQKQMERRAAKQAAKKAAMQTSNSVRRMQKTARAGQNTFKALCGYTSVKGCMAIKPAGYAIWENIQHELDRRFKETGVENVYMPIFKMCIRDRGRRG